jgi:hypothetical protein
MKFDHDLVTDLSFDLNPFQKKYIYIRGYLSTIALSIKSTPSSGKFKIQSSLASTEAFEIVSNHNNLTWENIKINGVSYSEVTFDIPSLVFTSPNILYFENTSLSGQIIRVDLRGNRS